MNRPTGKVGFAVFATTYVFAAALYVASAARAPAGGDWGDFVAAASVLGIAHPTGYPVYLQLLALPLLILPAAWAAAAADVANALLVALAPALLALWSYRLARGEGGDDVAVAAFAVLAGAFFAGAPPLWLEATSAEVYGAAFALLFGAFFLMDAAPRRGADGRLFPAAALLGGLAAGVHLTAFAYIFVLLVVWGAARRPRLRTILLAAAAWALGLSATLFLPLRAAAGPPLAWNWIGAGDLRTFALHVTGRQFSYNFRAPTWLLAAWRARELLAAAWRSGGPLVLLAPLGLWLVWRRSRAAAAALAAALALNVAFLLCYDIPDLESYQLPFVGLVFACAAAAAVALFRAAGPKLRVVAGLVAGVAVAFSLAGEWPRQRRDAGFVAYYGRQIVAPVGYRAVYISGTTTSNFLYWFSQYTLGRRPDVELYNINDDRFDIDKLAALAWREAGARPVFADYFFVYQTNQRRAFCHQGRPAGFALEVTDRETSAGDTWLVDAAVLARAERLMRARRDRPTRATDGLALALSVWEYRAFFHEYRDEPRRAEYYYTRAAELAPDAAMPHINLAKWYVDAGEYGKARRAARAALAAREGAHMKYMAYAYLAMAAQDEGALDAALEYARVSVALKPHDGKTHRLLAGIHLERGAREEAKRELERTLARGYNDPDAVMMLASIYREEGRDDEAFALLAANVHEYNDVRLMNAYALALIARGRYVEAKAELARAARIAPASPEIRSNLARLEAMGW
jgi:Tfp pilus assembly protein PilF